MATPGRDRVTPIKIMGRKPGSLLSRVKQLGNALMEEGHKLGKG